MKLQRLAVLMSLTLPALASAQVTSKTLVFENVDCEQTDSCGLKKFQIKITRDANDDSSRFLMSNTYMEGYYETQKISQVEDYVMVQYIKGGVFNEYKVGDAPIQTYRGMSRDHFGQEIPFVHPEMVVDSFDVDPVYASYAEKNDRHGLYKIKSDESRSVVFDDSKYYTYYFYRPEMKLPRMHFSDLPSGAIYSKTHISAGPNAGKTSYSSQSVSMEFTICAFKKSDVPENAGPKEVPQEAAIGCLDWSNHHVYNWETNRYEDALKVDPRAMDTDLKNIY